MICVRRSWLSERGCRLCIHAPYRNGFSRGGAEDRGGAEYGSSGILTVHSLSIHDPKNRTLGSASSRSRRYGLSRSSAPPRPSAPPREKSDAKDLAHALRVSRREIRVLTLDPGADLPRHGDDFGSQGMRMAERDGVRCARNDDEACSASTDA